MGNAFTGLLGPDDHGQIKVQHLKAWSPYLQWSTSLSQSLHQTLTSLPSTPPLVHLDDLSSVLHVPAPQLGEVAKAWEEHGAAEVVSPLLATRVSSEDLLITLNMLLEQADESEGFEGIAPADLEHLQETLDNLVEEGGPLAEGEPIQQTQLQFVLAKVLPLLQWPAILTPLTKAVIEQGMANEGGNQAAAAAPAAAASASASSSSASAPSKKRAAASSSSTSSSSGLGGGLDLSISGVGLKLPSTSSASSSSSSSKPAAKK